MFTAATLAASSTADSPPVPAEDGFERTGTASCGTGRCHGRSVADPSSVVQLDELTTWNDTRHANAYRTLLSAQSKRIAQNLGMARPETQPICLDCHADNVPVELRGGKFQLTDGVGCEACHGGAAQWLESHKAPGVDHADNLASGMYPTERPQARARLCLACHLGNDSQFATHELIGAGHPRLAFQLDVYAGWDEHYTDDADYRRRKAVASPAQHWLVGLAATGAQMIDVLAERTKTAGIEFALYHCDSCHHAVALGRVPAREPRWQKHPGGTGTAGMVRFNDAPLRILSLVLADSDQQGGSAALTSRLDAAAFEAASPLMRDDMHRQQLRRTLASLVDTVARADHSAEALRRMRGSLLGRATATDLRYHAEAEQIFLGVETLCYELGDCDQDALEGWRKTATDKLELDPGSFTFDLSRYQEAARRFASDSR